ncbi:hypothetical protein RIVM261_075780 [Rivularia sp. IAM M-261]|jgi:hypothetical protein|nr:hypothetical protein RIVM261_075780 [Rivularia sp. IAM M-261]
MAKKDDPNYKKLCGHIPKELFNELKKACVDANLDQSEALEVAVRQWLESLKK